jgi:fructuronate reductase
LRLSRLAADQLSVNAIRPHYQRAAPTAGVVHLGVGAFHRAHQAVYTDAAIAASSEMWGITGVSLRSGAVAAQLNPQDGLYTVSIRDTESVRVQLINAVREVLVASQSPAQVIARIAAPDTHIVSLTVTEKGYCRTRDGQLDRTLAGNDSIYRYLRDGLSQRKQSGLGGITLLSCDNLAANGRQLQSLLTQYIDATAPGLVPWFTEHCSCPNTMVDRIVPAATETDLDGLESHIGVRDEAAVFTEPFTQWIIEDRFASRRPRWEAGGAQFTQDVQAYETAKLRMLNGAHSALAYLGLARGHRFVHEAVADAPLRAVIESLMRDEAATSLTPAPGQDLNRYADDLLVRFSNAALGHRLAQIAMDGSQKIPQRWLETLAMHQRAGRSCPAILSALAAWTVFVRGDRWEVDDPRAAELAQIWKGADSAGVVNRLFGVDGLFSATWVASNSDRTELLDHLHIPAAL